MTFIWYIIGAIAVFVAVIGIIALYFRATKVPLGKNVRSHKAADTASAESQVNKRGSPVKRSFILGILLVASVLFALWYFDIFPFSGDAAEPTAEISTEEGSGDSSTENEEDSGSDENTGFFSNFSSSFDGLSPDWKIGIIIAIFLFLEGMFMLWYSKKGGGLPLFVMSVVFALSLIWVGVIALEAEAMPSDDSVGITDPDDMYHMECNLLRTECDVWITHPDGRPSILLRRKQLCPYIVTTEIAILASQWDKSIGAYHPAHVMFKDGVEYREILNEDGEFVEWKHWTDPKESVYPLPTTLKLMFEAPSVDRDGMPAHFQVKLIEGGRACPSRF